MAASAPPPNLPTNWINAQSSEEVGTLRTKGLEMKMSGMSLMTSFPDAPSLSAFNDTPGLSGSTVSTYSVDDPSRPLPYESTDQLSAKGSAPTSPLQGSTEQSASDKGMGKPPGLGGMIPSPTGNRCHSKNSSATSPLVTLTPNSSVDGTSDHYSLGRQQSPFQGDGPSMPYLRPESSKYKDENVDISGGLSNFGSFELTNGNNDGLLGLNALRDRSYSSPGPAARSAELAASSVRGQTIAGRNEMIGQHLEAENNRSVLTRPRAGSRDSGARSSRPPLSGGGSVGSMGSAVGGNGTQSPHAEGSSSLASDRSLGGLIAPLTVGRNNDTNQSTIASQDPVDSRGLGVISRPELRSALNDSGDEINDTRRRSIGSESGREYANAGYMNPSQNLSLAPGDRAQSVIDQSLAHKFSSMPTPSSHVQNRVPPTAPGQPQFSHFLPMQQQRPHHVRSYSLGGAVPDQVSMHDGSSMSRLPPGVDGDPGQNRFRSNSGGTHHGRSLSGDNFKPATVRRGTSLTHNMPGYDGNGATAPRRNSQPNMSSVPGFYGQHQSLQGMNPMLQRRDSREFVSGPGPVVASAEEMRMLGINGQENERQNRLVSPTPSPLHSHYGSSHSRHPSDRVNGSMSSPQSLGSSVVPCQVGQDQQSLDNYQGISRLEEDLSHPLAGEHIEVPADHSCDNVMHPNVGGFSHPVAGAGAYMVCDGPSHHLMHTSMSHSSVEKLSHHYAAFDSSHHLPTAGAALPSPKVVYNVKFKRTQRSFVLGPRINRDLKIGTYVKVEADRGEDLGIVVGKIPADKYNFSGRAGYRSNNMNEIVPAPTGLGGLGAADLKCIIRLATHDEVSLLSMKRQEEDELLKICRGKVHQRGLPMNVVDAEYQFDRHKLTFFFEAEGRIDFRELVRDLFSMYKTRIWMQQLDKNVANTSSGLASVAPPATMIDYGTPIIAPASEFSDSFPLSGLAGGETRSN